MTDDLDSATGGTLEELPAEECFELVATLSIGRVAWGTEGSAPVVVPVNYAVDGQGIVFRSDPGSKLEAIRGRSVSFQVDFIDPFHRTGWSVLIQGTAEVTAEADGHETVDAVQIEQWTEGPKVHWVRIRTASVSGRRIRLPEIELDPRGYL